jgi:stage III sporulation protein AE
MLFFRKGRRRLLPVLLLEVLLLWLGAGQALAANTGTEGTAENTLTGEKAALWEEESSENEDLITEEMQDAESLLGLEALDQSFQETTGIETFSFSGVFRKLLTGELPIDLQSIPSMLSGLFLSELREQKQLVLQILVIVLSCAVFSNFVRVFDSSQIAEISFYVMYLLVSCLLIRSFRSMNQIVTSTCNAILSFMKILLPSYLVTVVLSNGSASALGFYEITLLAINLMQYVILRTVLPMINFYLILLILNQISEEDYFSKTAKLLETVIDWLLKTVTGLVAGLQAVQCLIAPAADALKSTAVQRLAKAIPGIGNMIGAATETVAASALLIKNAAGVAGILALAAICLLPLVKLAVCILMFRFLCAAIQPVTEKRMVEGIESIARGAVLLLKLLVMSMAVFVISIAMITAVR